MSPIHAQRNFSIIAQCFNAMAYKNVKKLMSCDQIQVTATLMLLTLLALPHWTLSTTIVVYNFHVVDYIINKNCVCSQPLSLSYFTTLCSVCVVSIDYLPPCTQQQVGRLYSRMSCALLPHARNINFFTCQFFI